MLPAIFNKYFSMERWRVGVYESESDELNSSVINDLVLKANWLEIDGADFEADPFVLFVNEERFICYEKLNYVNGNAKLECIDLNLNKYNIFDEVNSVTGHKSFPSIFYKDDQIYCIPETSDLNRLDLFKFDYQKFKFSYDKTLLKGEDYCDSVIFEKNGLMYLFTSTTTKPYVQQLFICETNDFCFQPHIESPISTSVHNGRNAGNVVEIDNAPYRVCQDCSSTYGGGVKFMKIIEISKHKYSEKSSNITINNFHLTGVHTFNFTKGTICLDGKTNVYGLSVFLKKIIKSLRS
ncbi:hypothetical protein AB4379_16115 [Vibrio breoganii]